MKYGSLKVLLLVLATGGLIAACASGTDTTDFGTGGSAATSNSSGQPDTSSTGGAGGTGGVASTTTTVASTTTGATTSTGGDACVPKCNADLDCQNSCPATQTGINCCDAPSGFCYVASTAMCPMPNPAGSTTTGSGPY